MLKNILSFIALAGLAIIIIWGNWACNGSNKKPEKKDSNNVFNINDPTVIKFQGRLFSIPSPIQMAILVKDLKLPYNSELLNPTSNQPNYVTSFKQALNLGVYGANLGYLNIYEQLPDAAAYFSVVRVLSKELGVMNSFNEGTIKRIEANNNNKDSLVYILSTIYRDADSYLFNNERNDISVLILAGGWIESLYFMTQTLKQINDQKIIDRIGEQKYPLNNLIELLRPYYGKHSDEFDLFLEELVDLATIFDGVVIEYKYEQPIVDESNKLTIINSQTKTIITEYQIKKITEIVASLRKKMTS